MIGYNVSGKVYKGYGFMRPKLLIVLMMIVLATLLAACSAPTATPRPIGPTATERPFPTFGPTRTPKSTRTPRPTVTPTATETIMSAPTTTPTATTAVSARPAQGGGAQPIETKKAAVVPTGKLDRLQAPAVLRSALIKAGVNDPKVYWFTFDEGSHEQALLVQYASPLRWQDGYNEMLRAAKQTLGQYYLQIDPPLYTAFVVATDMTGTSDAVQRLRRYAPEKLARGEIGEEDFLNNYFEPEQVSIKCTGDGTCLGKMATPFPAFNFPFPFPTPTP
jgi:hypothetical protein